ncbi:unnamed protein product [Closterium sp. NIES-65]|nr:unnamed protein product [Closterium sp. NIES-65]
MQYYTRRRSTACTGQPPPPQASREDTPPSSGEAPPRSEECQQGSRAEPQREDQERGGGRYGLRVLPRRAHPTRAIKGGQSLLPKRRTVLGALEQNCSVCDAWPHTAPAAGSPAPQPPPPNSTSGTCSAWDLSPRGWGEAQSELRAAETSPPGPESGQPYFEEQGNLGLGGVRGTAPSPLQLADTPARSERAAERLQPQQVRWGAQWSQTRERELLPPTLPPPALHPPPYSPRGQQWSPGHDYPRRAHNHSAAHDALQTQPTEDGAGTAHCGENPNGPHEPRGPDAEATAAASAAEGTAPAGSASPATSQKSGSGGRDAEFPADICPIAAESHAARGRDAQGTRVDIHEAAGTGPAPDAPARHSRRRLGEHGIAQETRDDPPRAAEETTRAQDGARAPTQQDEPALGNAEAHTRGLAAQQAERSPRLLPRRGRDPRTPPSRPRREPRTPEPRLAGEEIGENRTPVMHSPIARSGTPGGRRVGGRGPRGRGAGRRGGRRTGASGYARTAEQLLREGAEGGEEAASREESGESENDESDEGDPVYAALAARHPQALQPLPEWIRTFSPKKTPSIEPRDFRRIVAKLPNGVGAGPSG